MLYGQTIHIDQSYNSTSYLLFLISCALILFHFPFHVPAFQLSQSPLCTPLTAVMQWRRNHRGNGGWFLP